MIPRKQRAFALRLLVAVLSHVLYLAFAWRHRESMGLVAAIFSFVPAVVTAYLFGLWPGLAGALVLVFVETPLVCHWLDYGYIFAMCRPGNIPGAAAIFAISAVIGRLHDLRIQLRDALQKRIASERALERKNRELMDLTAIITHDLRNPLAGIKGACQILGMHEAVNRDPDLRETIEMGHETVEYMQSLLDDLLDVAHIDGGEKKFDLKPLAMRQLVEKVVGRFKLQPRCERMVFDIDADVTVIADEAAVTKILMNLIGNAIAYMGTQQHPRISIGVTESGGVPAVYVRDNGMGIPAKSIDSVFGRFVRGDNVKTTTKGTGLGLFIVKGLVEAHGGRVWIESEEGNGTTVYFTLSAAHAQGQERCTAVPETIRWRGKVRL